MNVVVVESPAKAKTIEKYLGAGYKVVATYGHVCDLPSKDGSVRPDDNFAMDWVITEGSEKNLRAIVKALKDADHLYLATDPDREGEAISWHVFDELGRRSQLNGVEVHRVVFTEVTKRAVLEAMASPRALDDNLVDAAIEAITKVANTGKIGDGKIFVTNLEQVIRIRTGETGSDAL